MTTTLEGSIADLEKYSQTRRMAVVEDTQQSKQTASTYLRHVENYARYWNTYQAQLCAGDSTRVFVPAEPITPMKASIFIDHERSRNKVCRRHDGLDVTHELTF